MSSQREAVDVARVRDPVTAALHRGRQTGYTQFDVRPVIGTTRVTCGMTRSDAIRVTDGFDAAAPVRSTDG